MGGLPIASCTCVPFPLSVWWAGFISRGRVLQP
jgi:hypothetical protein